MGRVRVDRRLPDEGVVRDALRSGPPLLDDDERLVRLRPVLYPVWRMRVEYVAGTERRSTIVLLDGTWSGNEGDLSPYAPWTDPAATVEDDDRFEDRMVITDHGDEARARRTLEYWIEEWDETADTDAAGDRLRDFFGLPEEFGPDSFVAVEDATHLYLPFWVLELATDGGWTADEETELLSVRSTEPLVSGSIPERDAWLAERLRSTDGFYERFHRGAPDGGADDTGPADGSDDSPDDATGPEGRFDDASADDRSDAGPESAGDDSDAGASAGRDGARESLREEEIVQPEGLDMQAERLLESPPDRTFADVGGLADLKSRLRETVLRPLRHPERYEEYGLGTTNGVLLHGPPGCGKTYVAGALAGELGRWFLPISPTDFTSKWVGEAADNVAAAFEIARANQPCLVFVDEIDAVAADRSGDMTNTERQMVNQLLAELEAVDDEDVIVVAATNRVEDIDDAVLRAGRFDERVEVPPPDTVARREILKVHLTDRPTPDDLDLEAVAAETAGLAGSDLALVVERAARAAMDDEAPISTDHLLEAADETTTSIPTWLDGHDLGGRPEQFGPAESRAIHHPPGVGRDAEEVVSPPPTEGFESVAGMSEVLETVRGRVLDHVRAPDDGSELSDLAGVDGALLYGPPGCGKTHLARAVAGEVGCRFVHLRPGDLFGDRTEPPAEVVADLFEIVRANRPCLLFLDDLHEIADGRGIAGQRQQLLARLTAELRDVSDAGTLVLGATQLVTDLPESLLSGSVFDERIEVPPPSPETRTGVLRSTVPDRLRGAVDWNRVAEQSEGYATADLELVGRAAARRALRSDGTVDTDDLLAELDRVTSTISGWSQADRYSEQETGSDLRYIG